MKARGVPLLMLVLAAGCTGDEGESTDDGVAETSGQPTSAEGGDPTGTDDGMDDSDSDSADPSTSGDPPDPDDGSTTDPPDPTGATDDGDPMLDECLEAVAAVQFDSMPPDGQTKVPGLGECVTILDGESLYNYHCIWCHSTLDNNDLEDRTMERIEWAVDLSESNSNWPQGGLSDYPEAMTRILETVVASPPPVTTMHPHPLPEYE